MYMSADYRDPNEAIWQAYFEAAIAAGEGIVPAKVTADKAFAEHCERWPSRSQGRAPRGPREQAIENARVEAADKVLNVLGNAASPAISNMQYTSSPSRTDAANVLRSFIQAMGTILGHTQRGAYLMDRMTWTPPEPYEAGDGDYQLTEAGARARQDGPRARPSAEGHDRERGGAHEKRPRDRRGIGGPREPPERRQPVGVPMSDLKPEHEPPGFTMTIPLPTHAPCRKGDWMTTYSGIQFWPLDARPEEILLADIAHSLSQQCRFAGHTRRFYSIGEHSVRVASEVRRRLMTLEVDESIRRVTEKKALLHDATEAYLLDVPRPLKRQALFAGYRDLEAQLDDTIELRFELTQVPGIMRDLVKAVDNAMLLVEIRDLMPPLPAPFDALGAHAADPKAVPAYPYDTIVPWTAFGAETRFLELARELGLE